MTIREYDVLLELWSVSDGIIVDEMDGKEELERYLKRNPGLSFVAKINNKIVGTILCGHDGRRGLIRHLIVREEYRNQGISRVLVSRSLLGLKQQNISKCNAFVLEANIEGQSFWNKLGWGLLERDFKIMQSSTCLG